MKGSTTRQQGSQSRRNRKIVQNFKGNTDDKSLLVKRIEELTGQKAVYSFVPRCAYLFEKCAVEKDGSLSIEQGMNLDMVKVLLAECLITGRIEIPPEKPKATPEEIRKRLLADYGDKEITEAEAIEPLGLIKPEIALTMQGLTERNIRNLLNLIHSRGALISKATRGCFCVPTVLVDALGTKPAFDTVTDLLDFIDAFLTASGEEIKGLRLTPERITFTGYPVTDDRDVVLACMQLTAGMIRQCIEQRNILARPVDPTEGNEKYIFRAWLIRLGMNGPEFKETRDYLLFPLEGDVAFCTKKSADLRRKKLEAGKTLKKEQETRNDREMA